MLFRSLETGWTRQDWIKANLHTFDADKQELLAKHGKNKIVLYAPTFSPSITSLPHIKDGLVELTRQKDILLMLKFHPLTKKEWIDEYKALAAQYESIIWVDDFSISKYQLLADVMISDTSSTIYEFLLLNKPVITYNAISKDIYWKNITDISKLCDAYEEVLTDKDSIELRQWIVNNYDPYLDGKVAHRMLEGARDYIRRHGVPAKRSLNLWRKYTSIKIFGKIKRK